MQYTKSEEVYTDEAEGPRLQLIFLNIELRGGILFNASREDVLSCFNKMNKKSQKTQKKPDEVEFKCNTSRVRLFGC